MKKKKKIMIMMTIEIEFVHLTMSGPAFGRSQRKEQILSDIQRLFSDLRKLPDLGKGLTSE
jgi:hypothetical protein